MDNVDEENKDEKTRAAASDLAVRIRFLREEIKEGRSADAVEELRKKVKELGVLFPVSPDVHTINFEVNDIMETKPDKLGRTIGSGSTFCRRKIEILNPNWKEGGGFKPATISLLRKNQNRENLVEAPSSKILAPAFGGI